MFTTPAGFAQLTHLLMGLAEGKLILCMEVGNCLLPLGSGVLEGTTTGLIRLARILPHRFHKELYVCRI